MDTIKGIFGSEPSFFIIIIVEDSSPMMTSFFNANFYCDKQAGDTEGTGNVCKDPYFYICRLYVRSFARL